MGILQSAGSFRALQAEQLAGGRAADLLTQPASPASRSALPHEQVAALTGLQELRLRDVRWRQHDALAGMPLLTILEMSGCRHTPACLSRLTQLRVLTVAHEPWAGARNPPSLADAEMLSAALPHLQQLTRLSLMQVPLRTLAAVGSLARLRAAHLEPCAALYSPLETLPGGPWLASLQRLVAPAAMLGWGLASPAGAWPVPRLPGSPASQLLAAHGLQALGLLANDIPLIPPLESILWHAAQLPALELLLCDFQPPAGGSWSAVREAQQRRPDLIVQVCASAEEVVARVMG